MSIHKNLEHDLAESKKLRADLLRQWGRIVKLITREIRRVESKRGGELPLELVRKLDIASQQIAKLTLDPAKVLKAKPGDDHSADHSDQVDETAELSTIKIRSEAFSA